MFRFLLLFLSVVSISSGAYLAHERLVVPVFGFFLTLIGMGLSVLLFCFCLFVLIRAPKRKFSKFNFLGLLYSICGIGALAFLVVQGIRNPINDISTDTKNPPLFKSLVTLVPVEEGADLVANQATLKRDYHGDFSLIQKEKYPFVISARSSYSPKVISERLPDFIKKIYPDWKLSLALPEEAHFEYQEESPMYHFVDDIVLEVRLNDPLKNDSVFHIRSRSRDGKSDLGMNAKRIGDLIEQIKIFNQQMQENKLSDPAPSVTKNETPRATPVVAAGKNVGEPASSPSGVGTQKK